jgi:hypothetical protein
VGGTSVGCWASDVKEAEVTVVAAYGMLACQRALHALRCVLNGLQQNALAKIVHCTFICCRDTSYHYQGGYTAKREC